MCARMSRDFVVSVCLCVRVSASLVYLCARVCLVTLLRLCACISTSYK